MNDAALEQRKRWFDWYATKLDMESVQGSVRPGQLYRCPCCHCRTLQERGGFDICPVCFWEDDGQDEHDAETVRGGPNGALSLCAARENYVRYGACEPKFIGRVRPPGPEEMDG